jgi:hypothetical protein
MAQTVLLFCRRMAVLLTCRYCRRTGFVRFEHVITKGQALHHFYCGACDRTWEINEQEGPQLRAVPKPKSKRPIKRTS